MSEAKWAASASRAALPWRFAMICSWRERHRSTAIEVSKTAKGQGRELDLGRVEEDAVDGLVGDPDAGDDHEAGFDEGGEVLDLAVAVGVVFVGGLAGDADGEEGEAGAEQVDAGVGGVGEHAERAGEDSGDDLEEGHRAGGEDGEQRGAGLFGGDLLCFLGWRGGGQSVTLPASPQTQSITAERWQGKTARGIDFRDLLVVVAREE